MLRYRADLRTLVFCFIFFALVAIQWIFAPTQLVVAVPLVALTCVFSFLGAVATHNTVHCPMFRSRALNRAMQVVLTLVYGHPVSAYVPGHNLSHHKNTQSRSDLMRTTKVRYRWHLLNGLLFMPTVGGSILAGEIRYFRAMRRRNPPFFRQMLVEAGVLVACVGALVALDWKKFIVYVLVPHQYAAWGIITMNLLQHDGCDQDSAFDHSRNFTGKIVNFLAYNNGFHSIHHMEPGLHWSLLPAAHAEKVAPFIHPSLEQPNLITYLFRTFVWPAKRIDYRGEPLVLPEAGADAEWIPSPEETPADVSLGAAA